MSTILYFPGMGGNAGISPALAQLDGFDVVIPAVPGFAGEVGFTAPTDYLGWLVATWDAVDATGASSTWSVTALVTGVSILLSEATSNTATATLMVPIAADLAIAATVIAFDARLMTRNVKHFPMFEGLSAPY